VVSWLAHAAARRAAASRERERMVILRDKTMGQK